MKWGRCVVKGLIPHPERWECCSRSSDPMTGGLSTRKVKVGCTLPAHPGHGQGGPWGQWGSALLHQTADKVHVTKCSKKLKKQIITWYSSPTFRYIHRRIENRRPKQINIHYSFIAVLFMIAGRWKQLKCSSTDEWINKMQYVPTMEYYSTKKSKEVLIHNAT